MSIGVLLYSIQAMENKCIFTERLISLLAVQEGLIPASAIGLSIKQAHVSVKNQLRAENRAIQNKRSQHAKRSK